MLKTDLANQLLTCRAKIRGSAYELLECRATNNSKSAGSPCDWRQLCLLGHKQSIQKTLGLGSCWVCSSYAFIPWSVTFKSSVFLKHPSTSEKLGLNLRNESRSFHSLAFWVMRLVSMTKKVHSMTCHFIFVSRCLWIFRKRLACACQVFGIAYKA